MATRRSSANCSPTTHNQPLAAFRLATRERRGVQKPCLITNSEARSEAGAASWRHLDEWIRRLPSSAGSDAYFLRCGPGVSVPPHTDPSRPELEHHRLNVVLSTAHEGGDVTIDGEKVEWEPGDALIFRPDLSNHEVSTVSDSASFGALDAFFLCAVARKGDKEHGTIEVKICRSVISSSECW